MPPGLAPAAFNPVSQPVKLPAAMAQRTAYPGRPRWLTGLARILAGGLLATWTLVAWPCCHAPDGDNHAATRASASISDHDHRHDHRHRDGHDADDVAPPLSDAPDTCAMDMHHGDAAPGPAAIAPVNPEFASLPGVAEVAWAAPPHKPASPAFRIVVKPPPVSGFPVYLRVERLLI